MATIGNVMVTLGGDAAGFARTMGSVAGTLTSTVGRIAKIGGIITAALSGLAGLGLGLAINQVSGLGDEFLATSQKTGIAVEMLSSLKLAAKLNNAEFGDLTTGIRLMQRNLANADEEGQAARDTLTGLGLTAADITSGMKDGAGFLETFAQKIAGIDEPAKRVQAAMAVMGRQGSNLIPLLLDIADRGLGGIRRESDALGNTFSTKLAVASDRFRDNMDKLGAALQGLKVTIIGPLVTALAALTEQFLKSDLFAKIREQIEKLASSGVLETWAKKAVFFVIDAFMFMTRTVATVFSVLVEVGFSTFNSLARAAQTGVGAIFVFFGALTDSVSQVITILPTILTIGAALQAAVGNFTGFAVLGAAAIAATANMDAMQRSVQSFGNNVGSALARAQNSMAQFNAQGGLKVPEGIIKLEDTLNTVATNVENFGNRAKKSFDTVRAEVQRTTTSSDRLTEPLDEARTSTGELVKVSGGLAVRMDEATGRITVMNRELLGTLTLVRQINTEAVNPVQ